MTNKILFICCLALIVVTCVNAPAVARKISSPPPIDKDDMVSLKNYLRQIYDEWDTLTIYTADPTSPKNGEAWIVESGSTHQLCWRAGGVTYYVNGTAR